MAAFHRALMLLGIGENNLVRLSSVIPPGWHVDPSGATPAPTGGWGDRLYCVYAEQRTCTPGEEAWAGIGWIQRVDGQGGLFVEHEGGSEAFVRDAITKSLTDMAGRYDVEFEAPECVVSGVHCTGEPVCALVVAPYQSAPWTSAH